MGHDRRDPGGHRPLRGCRPHRVVPRSQFHSRGRASRSGAGRDGTPCSARLVVSLRCPFSVIRGHRAHALRTSCTSSRFNDWAGATPAHERRLDRYVLIGSLPIAAVQGAGIASALEKMRNVVDEPGPQFRLMAIATFVAATALLVWLAAMISRHGLGSGVWVLL